MHSFLLHTVGVSLLIPTVPVKLQHMERINAIINWLDSVSRGWVSYLFAAVLKLGQF